MQKSAPISTGKHCKRFTTLTPESERYISIQFANYATEKGD